jgi:hypothetical protein
MVANLSASHMKLMVSVWSKFDLSTSFYKEMSAAGYMINGTSTRSPAVTLPACHVSDARALATSALNHS